MYLLLLLVVVRVEPQRQGRVAGGVCVSGNRKEAQERRFAVLNVEKPLCVLVKDVFSQKLPLWGF